VQLGGPRASRTKINPGEKEVFCSALGATSINAGYNEGEKCDLMDLETILLSFCWCLLCVLRWGKSKYAGAALITMAVISDVKTTSNMILIPDTTPRSFTSL